MNTKVLNPDPKGLDKEVEATMRAKFSSYLESTGWPPREFVLTPVGTFQAPSLEQMFNGYIIAHQQMWVSQIGSVTSLV